MSCHKINRTLLYGSSDLMKALSNGNLIIHLKQFILQNVLSSSNVNFLCSFIFSLANSGYKGMFSPANSTCPLSSSILAMFLGRSLAICFFAKPEIFYYFPQLYQTQPCPQSVLVAIAFSGNSLY